MLSSFVSSLIVTALLSTFSGAAAYRYWAVRQAREKKRIPANWHLRPRPLFSDVERTVWRWLKQVFFDQQLLMKVPVTRFLSPLSASQGPRSHELLKGISCSFTVCRPDGTVVGCIDVPGIKGLKASHRDMKQKLFSDCGIAYTVLSASNLPTLEGLRVSFLGAAAPGDPLHGEFTASFQPSASEAPAMGSQKPGKETVSTIAESGKPDLLPGRPQVTPALGESPQGIDMVAVAAARSSLQNKLERNRKIRQATIESLSASMGIVDDSEDKGYEVVWHDSFIMSEQPEGGEKRAK